jgi:hypothetical protein
VRLAGILQRQDVGDDQPHHQCSANEVQLEELLFPRGLRRPSILGHDEQEKYHNRCDSADGQVDVKALERSQPAHLLDRSSFSPTHRHDTLSVNAPPMSGPSTAAIPYVAPVKPNSCGRFSGDAEKPTIVNTPTATPEPPTPAIARPTIRVLGHSADQASDLEDEQGEQVPELQGEVSVQFAPGGLESCGGQQRSLDLSLGSGSIKKA